MDAVIVGGGVERRLARRRAKRRPGMPPCRDGDGPPQDVFVLPWHWDTRATISNSHALVADVLPLTDAGGSQGGGVLDALEEQGTRGSSS